MESGTGSFWTYIPVDAAKESFEKVTKATSCPAGSSPDTQLDCLLSASSSAIASAVKSVPCRDACTWAPVVDGVLVKGRTVEVARAGGLRPKTPIIAGFNLNDGAMFVPGYPISTSTMTSKGLTSYFTDRFGDFATTNLQKEFPVPSATAVSWISNYFYSAQACETDFSYSCTAEWVASAVSGSQTYVYQFSEPTSNGLVLHGDEIGYVFGTLSKPTASQTTTSNLTMSYWANFAKTGSVNGNDLHGNGLPDWPLWSEKAGALLNITATPKVALTPNNSFVGCPFFHSNWDYYGGCLPP